MCSFNFNNNLENPEKQKQDLLNILGLGEQNTSGIRARIQSLLSDDEALIKKTVLKPIAIGQSKHPLSKALRIQKRALQEYKFLCN